MTKIKYLCLLMALITCNLPLLSAKEVTFTLESHQKKIGTYSGDLDQKSSVHLVLFEDKKTDDFRIKPFFIDEHDNIMSLSEVVLQEEPIILSYHFQSDSSDLILLVQQDKNREQSLEVIDINILSNTISRSTMEDYQDAYMVLRSQEQSFLIYKEKKSLQIITVEDSKDKTETEFRFQGEDLDHFKNIFRFHPEFVNTNEYVEYGSIRPSKTYFMNGKLIFDYRDTDEYINLSLDPKDNTASVFQQISLEDIRKVKDITTYLYDSKIFLFINDKEDIHMRSYDLLTGDLLVDIKLQEDLAGHLDPETLENIIKKSSRTKWSLTGTVNESTENSMVVNLAYVRFNNYNYHHNWWQQHQFLQQHMMRQQQMMRTHMQMQSFGPGPGDYFPAVMPEKKATSIQLVIDQNLNILENKEAATLRPKIDKNKYLRPLQENRKVKDLSIAFTRETGRILYYSKKTDSFHVKSFDL